MYYNEEQKQRYFLETQEKRKFIFEKASEIEEKYQKDLSEFNREQFIELMESYKRFGLDAIKKDFTTMRKYLRWCARNPDIKVDANLLMVWIHDVNPLHYIKDIAIKDSSALYPVDSYFSSDDGYYDLSVMLLVWYGISIEDIIDLMEDDVSFSRSGVCNINTCGRTVQLSRQDSNVIRRFMSVQSATRSNRYGSYVAYPIRDGKFLYRMYNRSTPFTRKGVCASIKLHCIDENVNLNVDLNNVGASGRMYRYYQLDRKGLLTDEIMSAGTRGEKRDLESEQVFYRCYKSAFWE